VRWFDRAETLANWRSRATPRRRMSGPLAGCSSPTTADRSAGSGPNRPTAPTLSPAFRMIERGQMRMPRHERDESGRDFVRPVLRLEMTAGGRDGGDLVGPGCPDIPRTTHVFVQPDPTRQPPITTAREIPPATALGSARRRAFPLPASYTTTRGTTAARLRTAGPMMLWAHLKPIIQRETTSASGMPALIAGWP